MKSVIIGTAGHIDHGKTALVKALTGVDTDRLPEEKARGITIDLGFAHVQWGDIDVSFIDVPGHEKFVKNMLAGIGGIDLLMLVIAADESIMPQTREHFDICRLLSIPSGIVVLTKIDQVDTENLTLVRQELSDMIQGSFLENAPVFEVSAKTGAGIDSLKQQIVPLLRSVPRRPLDGIFRLPVDRVFTLKGHGTVITGTLLSGSIQKDAQVEILPPNLKTKVRSIHAHNSSVSEASAGQRTALNLQGIEKDDIVRGDVLTEPDFFQTTSLLDAKIALLPTSRPLQHNALVRFHHLTSDVAARITLFGKEMLSPGESGLIQLRLQRPVLAVHGDRFILRKSSPLMTIAGGVILDGMPMKRAAKSDLSRLNRLEKLEKATMEQRFALAVAEKGSNGAEEKWLKAKLAIPPTEIGELKTEDVIVLKKNPLLTISRDAAALLMQKIVETVTVFHQSNPLLPGISKEELRSKFFARVPAGTFLAIVDLLASENRLQVLKDVVALHGRKVLLSSKEELLAAQAEEILTQAGLAFPGFNEMASRMKQQPDQLKKWIYLFVREGKVIKIADDYFLHRKNWEDLIQRMRALKNNTKNSFGGGF